MPHRLAQRATVARLSPRRPLEPGAAAGGGSSSALRARWSALFTAATEVPSASAVSRAENPKAERMIGGAGRGRRTSSRESARSSLALLDLGLGRGSQDTGQQGAVVRVPPRLVVDRHHGPPPVDRVQARVRRDPVEPGANRAPALEFGSPRQARSSAS